MRVYRRNKPARIQEFYNMSTLCDAVEPNLVPQCRDSQRAGTAEPNCGATVPQYPVSGTAVPWAWHCGTMALMPQCCGAIEWYCSASSLELLALLYQFGTTAPSSAQFFSFWRCYKLLRYRSSVFARK
ncbi:hypothetical protein PanWU01x14_273920 [Parasponia andersonii]|uniref:Uncharacterized protein n=1 Tax=Parasponia andersonii TaxID=3476 RepID=A0A2P5B3T9_PARAD|nr:hypothetical protein PanWU01x14_273920 [Parasponia andersonii]